MIKIYGLTRFQPPGWEHDGTQVTPTLIELTAKRWKGLILVSYVLFAAGLLIMGQQLWSGLYRPLFDGQLALDGSPISLLGEAFSGLGAVFGTIAVVLALAVMVYARFMAWWRHG
ncbi:MAG: hypothetical protein QGH73_15225 [Rhodospirillales bacterium]|jgi:hypothetical protein|nr:hypothetical protein [Rhodospirillaceae bacterium]MDP6429654.1 hypothetical protein [Rhodospirillales bacterium]MDP6644147.1 hypothetical protein [Rhodospirillales bacterium]MDP6843020.1 hypothetical protein [Rhodospirillales bacterium]|tara:strand:- start:5261 stop:5605 length:345 start_codon:yes stop_codon:yes gene_type:complete